MGKKRLIGVLLIIAALIVTSIPVTEADAAASASDFLIKGKVLEKYEGTAQTVSIPDTVETIGKSAFENNKKIEYVIIPNSVKQIEAYAFWGCDNLKNISLGSGLRSVPDYSFTGCKGLKNITLPSTISAIGIQAFGDCVNLEEIIIPKEVQSIQESAFDGCGKLVIRCEEGSIADQFAQKFYEKQKENQEYEDVPEYEFVSDESEENHENMETEDSGQYDHTQDDGNSNLLGSTQVVGNQAFVFLDKANLPVVSTEQDVNQENNTENQILTEPTEDFSKYAIIDGKIIADQAYYKKKTFKDVTIPNGVAQIGEFSFARSSVETVKIPDGVVSVDYGAFYHCDSLREVSLPESVMVVEPYAFAKTKWVQDFYDSDAEFLISGGVLIAYHGESSEIQIPEGVRVIAARAFEDHTELTMINCPKSLEVIGEEAFDGCSGIQKVTFEEGLIWVKDRAFSDCIGLETVVLPESLKYLGLNAFCSASQEFLGKNPEVTYEDSATRLYHYQYRNLDEPMENKVTIEGCSPAWVQLDGAIGEYKLIVKGREEIAEFESAWKRATNAPYPEALVCYDMKLEDKSVVPIKRVSQNALKVVLPVPEELKEKQLRAITLDRNGQLENLPIEVTVYNGKKCFGFQTDYVAPVAIYSIGNAPENEEIIEFNGQLTAFGRSGDTEITNEQSKEADSMNIGIHVLKSGKLILATILLLTGIVVLLPIGRKNYQKIN